MPDDGRDQDSEPTSIRKTSDLERVVRLHGVLIEVAIKAKFSKSLRMTQPVLTVGKGDDVDLSIDDRSVSRHHLSLEIVDDGLLVRDLGSSNGTWVAGCRIYEVRIVRDTTLSLGEASITLHLEKEASGLEVSTREEFGGALGTSTGMRHVFALLQRAARTTSTVLFEGESGTGKEVLARALHLESARSRHPFVAVDCASIPENLIESELFGHERGAFTGAVQTRVGAFEEANGGTLFLDEIGELPLSQQAKLLRVLETHDIRRVGGSKAISIDVRIVAATNRSLVASVAKKKFRRDLFYRLSVLRIVVPPLRQRKRDIPVLAHHFLARTRPDANFPPELMQVFLAHSWPGNVRELRNAVERWATFGAEGPELLFDENLDSPNSSRAGTFADFSSLPYHEAKRRALEAFDRDYFPKVLLRAGGIVTKAAELASVPRPSFHRMLARARGTKEDAESVPESGDP
jgi:transcriptional regulator with PAS, ATPase and Fis domain